MTEENFFYRISSTKENHIRIEQFEILSGTEKGVTILTSLGRKKFIAYSRDDTKRFAYKSKREALQKFIIAKQVVAENLWSNYSKTLKLIAEAKKTLKSDGILV
jgi:hypothetical protein